MAGDELKKRLNERIRTIALDKLSAYPEPHRLSHS